MSVTVSRMRLAVGAASGALLLYASSSAASALSGSATLTSDYVWRGSSQSQEEPAVQAGFDYAHVSGLYASVWGGNVDFGPGTDASSEFDLVLGWAGGLSPVWELDLSLVRYLYPEVRDDLNWNELNLGLTWNDRYGVLVAYSDDALASDSDGWYVQLNAAFPLTGSVYVGASAGRYFLNDVVGDDYSHGALTLGWAFDDPFALTLTLHGTDSEARRLFPDMAGTRAEVALTATF